MTVRVEPASREDLPEVLTLLQACGLPPDGLEEHLETTLVAREGEVVFGSAAIEAYGSHALLRSVAVAEDHRGGGLGQRLTEVALDLARRDGVSRVYLLTETADRFFPRFGSATVERSQVPEAVRGSIEFVSACPESARAMALCLNVDPTPATPPTAKV